MMHLLLFLLFLLGSFQTIAVHSQDSALTNYPEEPLTLNVISANGTGQTTGHIADLTVQNNGTDPILTRPQTFYIPSDGRFQSYVGHIPGAITIHPGETVDVPAYGVCTDPRKPPVPDGESMLAVDQWITVQDGTVIEEPSIPSTTVAIVPAEPIDNFDPGQIEDIIASEGFNSSEEPPGDIVVTWPGTDEPVQGTFDVTDHPEDFAAVIVDAVNRLEDAAESLIESGDVTTPFSSHPGKEKEALLQQATWMVVGQLMGEPYTRDDFEDNVYEQFESNTGTPVTSLPQEEKEKVDSGVEEFWGAFTATGVEAKVLKDDSEVLISSRDDDCQCDTLTFTLSRLSSKGLYEEITSHTTTTFSAGGKEKLEDVTLPPDEFEEIELKVSNVKFKCSCKESLKCDFYSGTKMTEETKSKFDGDVRESSTVGAASISDESQDGKEFTFTINSSKDFKNVYIYIKLKGYCMNEDCDRKTCTRRFQIQFIKEQEEEE